jgi:hypothetical protein
MPIPPLVFVLLDARLIHVLRKNQASDLAFPGRFSSSNEKHAQSDVDVHFCSPRSGFTNPIVIASDEGDSLPVVNTL